MPREGVNRVGSALGAGRWEVELSAERRDEGTWIHVDADGPGSPEDQRGHLFEPFARLDESRARHTGGHGLGLAIVQQVAKLHGGTVRAESPGLELGSTFTVTLPMLLAGR